MREDLTGKRFGHLLVIKPATDEITKSGGRIPKWECLCDCGATVITRASSLKSGHTKGCGQKHRAVKNMVGLTFGKLTVLERAEDYINADGTKHVRWLCRCECGEERDIRAGTLVSGNSLSCGCYKHERLAALAKKGFGVSKSEQIVNEYLRQAGVYYETQFIDSKLRGKAGYPLSFDFLVYKDGSPWLFIECQGKQHYEPVEYFGGEEQFKVQKHNDDLKRKYVLKHGLTLLEIPYTCKTQESIFQLLSVYI